MLKPFLREVAEVFIDNESDEMLDYCFVTPNKRSAVFLSKYFCDILHERNSYAMLPAIVTISDFVGEFDDKIEASRMEQLFILYNVYSDIIARRSTKKEIENGENRVDFNKFQFWGEILLNDFSDVDRYVADAAQLFKNIESLREISSNFLTPEQIEVIRRYWNDDLVPEPVKEFWKHIVHTGNGDSSSKKNVAGFLKLWQVMSEVYTGFRQALDERGMTYSGKAYRDAIGKIKDTETDSFRYVKYIFVGFNVLSTSEREMFRELQRRGIADFYWDYASPALRVPSNRAARFISHNVKEFPSFYKGIGTSVGGHFPQVDIIAVPSAIGQAKSVPAILEKLHPDFFGQHSADDVVGESGNAEKGEDEERESMIASLVDTAVVLPDENLVQPLLEAMPEEIPVVNVTMSYSLRHTPVASLLRNVVSLQLRARELRSEGSFFYEDVIAVLSHPLIRNRFSDVCNAVIKEINEQRLFNIPASFFDNQKYEPLKVLFTMVSNANDPDAVTGYLSGLFQWMATLVEEDRLQLLYVEAYKDAVAELCHLRDRYISNIFLEDKTVFHLVERLAGNRSVQYEGMPLRGLQIMGVLETRCLDFPNLVITSMNERIFPRRHYTRTFIPNALRRGYGMSTIEHQESIYAYYFYRMISRAERLFILYDSRTAGARSGVVSRYVNQMRYQSPHGKVRFFNSTFMLQSPVSELLEIKKDRRILDKIERFRSETDRKYLSASSINEYINCPMKFYLTHVEEFYDENEVKEYMDEGTYGTIIHEVAEKLYMDARGDSKEIEITPKLISHLSDPRRIKLYLERAIREHYLGLPPDDPRELTGDAAIYLKIMGRTIAKMFERESEFTERTFFVDGEQPRKVRLKVSDDMTVNLSFRIDRIDRFIDADGESVMRLIDYKTGGDGIRTKSIESLFDSRDEDRQKAILQLLLYCEAYAQHEGYHGRVQPYLYRLRSIAIDSLQPLRVGKEKVVSHNQFSDEFMKHLERVLSEIFDESVPFRANPTAKHCKYCRFKEACGIE